MAGAGRAGVQRAMLPIALADDPEAALRELRERDPETFARLETEARQAGEASGGRGSGPPVPAIFTSWLVTAQQAEQRFRQTGDLAALTTAIEAWSQILEHPEFQTAPPNFRLAILNNAGGTFLQRYWAQGQVEDLNRALTLWTETVDATPPDAPDRPAILNNLGNGLRDRYARTRRLADLEQAIDCWQQAVAATPPDSPDRPSRLTNLGNGLRARYARAGRLADLEQAIDCWQQAVAATPPDSPDLPIYLTNLGNGLRDRYARSGRLEDLEQAITACQQALTVFTRETMPLDWARTTMSLASAYQDRIRGERAENLEAAIAAYQQARTVFTRAAMPLEWAQTTMNLASAYQDRIRGERAENLEAAIAAYQQALTVFHPALFPDDCRRTAQALGNLYAETGDWATAADTYDLALQAAESLYQDAASQSGKEAELSANGDLFRRAAYALVRAARPGALERAVKVAELGRARGLGETLARDRADFTLIERDHPAIYERYRTAAETVRFLERADRAAEVQQAQPETARFTDLAERIRAARAELDKAIDAIRALPGYEGFLLPPTYAEIAATAQPGAPLVYLITTPQGSVALIVPHGAAEPEALLLDGFTEDDLDALLIERANDEVIGGYLPGQFLGGAALTAALERGLPRLGAALIAPLAARLRTLSATGVTLIPTGLLGLLPLHAATYAVDGQPRCLLDEFDVAYAPSARVLAIAQRELKQRAEGVQRLAGVGNPLPAIETGAWAQRELAQALPAIKQQAARLLPVIDTAARSAPPAVRERLEQVASIWRASLERLEALIDQTPDQVVKAGHDLALAAALFAVLPDGAGQPLAAIARRIPPSLTYARSELASVLDLLPPGASAPLYEQAATRDAIRQALPESTIAHFACHGQFDADDTLDSALLLAQESRLTLRELVAGDTAALATVRLAVLSACQTAITDFRRVPDESIGLPGGFLQAGVPAVVGSLWSVNDLSTALLMHRFYELHLKGDPDAGLGPQPLARALRLAQLWLRDLTCAAMFDYLERHRQLQAAQQLQNEAAATATTRMPFDLIAAGLALAEEGMLDDPSYRPYADPMYWAAFTFNGALEGA